MSMECTDQCTDYGGICSMARSKGEGGLTYVEKKGLWEASVELPPLWDEQAGKWKRRRRKVSSKNKRTAMQKLQAARREVEQGNVSSSSTTVQAWVDYWFAEVAPKKISPNTIKSYRSSLKHVTRRYGDQKLGSLTPQKIRELTADLATSKSPSTARNVHGYLKSCLDDALGDGVISAHPMAHLQTPARGKTKENALSTDKAVELLRWLVRQIDEATEWADLAPAYITYLLTGTRRSEVLALQPERVGDTLDISWQLQRLASEDVAAASADLEITHITGNFYLTRPKYGSMRQIPLVEPLRSLLHLVRDHTPEGQLMFLRPDGTPWDPDGIGYRWKKILYSAGIESPPKYDSEGRLISGTDPADHVKLHGARHGLVDILWEMGIDPENIKDIVGHTSREMTEKYRTRISPETKAALEEMSRRLQLIEA